MERRGQGEQPASVLDGAKKILSRLGTKAPVVVNRPRGDPKLSERLLDLAEPLLDACDDERLEERVIGLATTAWNLSLIPEDTRDEFLEDALSEHASDPEFQAQFREHVGWLMERKMKRYPSDRRFVLHYKVSGTGADRELDVAFSESP